MPPNCSIAKEGCRESKKVEKHCSRYFQRNGSNFVWYLERKKANLKTFFKQRWIILLWIQAGICWRRTQAKIRSSLQKWLKQNHLNTFNFYFFNFFSKLLLNCRSDQTICRQLLSSTCVEEEKLLGVVHEWRHINLDNYVRPWSFVLLFKYKVLLSKNPCQSNQSLKIRHKKLIKV